MTLAASQRVFDRWAWPACWTWPERLAVLVAWIVPISVLIAGGLEWGWLAGALNLLALLVLHVVVCRHGGWQLLGPHFYYDVVRLARRGQSTRLRVAYLLALFVGLVYIYVNEITVQSWRPNEFARVSERFAYVLFLVQNIAVMVLTPVYLASAIPEEKERRTLELLFTTQLGNMEIVLGILFSRTIHLAGFVLAGLPILTVIQFWGGIDMLLLAANLANTVLNIVTIGSFCVLISTFTKTVSSAVMVSYAFLLPVGTGCMACVPVTPFVLQDARAGGGIVWTVQDLGSLFIVHAIVSTLCLALAMVFLRENELIEPGSFTPDSLPQGWKPREPDAANVPAEPARRRMVREPERLDVMTIPYTLPPVADNALLWKERFLGGPAMLSTAFFLLLFPVIVISALNYFILFLGAILSSPDNAFHSLDMGRSVLNFMYYVFVGCYGVGVAFRATSSVTRERQQNTLEPLLLLPVERSEILGMKWLACLWRGWPWLALIAGDLMLGMIIGAFHPFSVVLLCLAPWPMFFFFVSLGLLLSVTVQTVLRANLIMVLVIILFLSSMALSPVGHASAGYLDVFAFSWWDLRHLAPERLVIATALLCLYLLGAWICWRIAFYLFERRSYELE